MVLKQCCRSGVEAMLQKTMLQRWCRSNAVKDSVAEAMLEQCCKRRCYNGVVENVPPKDNLCICGK
jgi:hypothetical protein